VKLSIVLSTHETAFKALAYSKDLETSVQGIAAQGYDGVELAVRDPNLLDAVAVAGVMEAQGLVVPAIGTGQAFGEEGLSFTDPDDAIRKAAVQRIRDQVDFASTFNAVVILGLIRGRSPQGKDRKSVERMLRESLADCSEYAVKQGVRLAVEPINRYETDLLNTVEEVLALIDQAGLENTGVLFDTFHANIEEPSMEGSLRACFQSLYHVHVADSNRWAPGDGHIDFSRIVDVLHGEGYQGFLSAETLPLPDPGTCARRTIRHLRPLLPGSS